MPYLLVPQNSTITVKCAFENTAEEPFFEIDIANTTFKGLEFEDSRRQREILRNHGIIEVQQPTQESPLAVIEIDTLMNNGTKIFCKYIGNLEPDWTKLLVYGLLYMIIDIVS